MARISLKNRSQLKKYFLLKIKLVPDKINGTEKIITILHESHHYRKGQNKLLNFNNETNVKAFARYTYKGIILPDKAGIDQNIVAKKLLYYRYRRFLSLSLT